MPSRTPFPDVPTWNPVGSTDMNAAMTQWVSQFGEQYKQNSQNLDRRAYIVSTNTASSTTNPANAYITKHVTLQGGEQVQVFGFFDFQVSAGGAMTTNSTNATEMATGKLRITFPGGGTKDFGNNQEARLRVTVNLQGTSAGTVQRTTVTQRAMVGFAWPVEARFQTGGDHLFSFRTSGAGTVEGGQMTIVVT